MIKLIAISLLVFTFVFTQTNSTFATEKEDKQIVRTVITIDRDRGVRTTDDYNRQNELIRKTIEEMKKEEPIHEEEEEDNEEKEETEEDNNKEKTRENIVVSITEKSEPQIRVYAYSYSSSTIDGKTASEKKEESKTVSSVEETSKFFENFWK